MTQERDTISDDDKWGVEALFTSQEAAEKAFSAISWEELLSYKGKLESSLKEFLDRYFSASRALTKVYTYAHLRHDEDVANEKYKNFYDRVTTALYSFDNDTSWIKPEILQLSSANAAGYEIYLDKITRLKPFILSADKEELISLAARALESSDRAFSMLSNADLKFPDIKDRDNKEHALTQGSYGLHLQSTDRTLRENAFVTLHDGYAKFENTLTELISGQVHAHLFDAKARGYTSCVEAALFPHHIDPSVYTTLVDTIRANLAPLHDYVSFRKKELGLKTLHFYDLYCPLVKEPSRTYSYDEAKQLVIDSAAPLGSEYQSILTRGLSAEKWVDKYENARKRSGAYSSGCYDSHPFILMNFHGTARDVSTLMHEAGHSMHSYYSNKSQPFHYARYPIFLAEIASTFNEELLFRHMMNNVSSKEEEKALINQRLDDIRGTLYRQSMFAEFELTLHEYAEKGTPLTPTSLKTEYRNLNKAYYGPDLTIDDGLDIEFLRVPHFYYNFYVYQYATGLSAAYALAEKVLKTGDIEPYIAFLSSGSSKPPLELLKEAGVDLTKGDATIHLINNFKELSKKVSE